MPRGMTHADQHKESHERNETEDAEDNRRPSKDDIRLEHQEAANDCSAGLRHMLENVVEQT